MERGLWRPYEPPELAEPQREPTFHEFASQWYAAREPELAPKTRRGYRWRLSNHLLPFFADYRLSEISVELVDRYRAAKVRESERLRAARARGEKTPRPLSNESINKTLVLLASILETAVEYGRLDRNPARGRRRRLKVARPERSSLDRAAQIAALLDAAAALDREARAASTRHRHALLAALAFGGFRISEALELRWGDVDLAAGRVRVGKAKTAAGVRHVDLLPALRDALSDLKARRRPKSCDRVFPTLTGGRPSESNVRRRILAAARERACEALARAGEVPLPHLTPHSLRRTFASVLYALGHDPADVMEQMGHSDPRLALRIYAQAMRRGEDEKRRLRALVKGADWAPLGTTVDSEAPVESSDDPSERR
ncbi:tyrosine-type recombinase/integrase [Thermoleophilum album]|uniref:tyrosine-type recombinase/integrase n=1 Tax=Thermoleophilum album TaxID=29539 RepID=UPI00237C6C88|nr:site-specific integrase [Thermoleophilum album]WDT93801.1 tyrosine-type recombinase/integrase [Thermoleophilum album]